MELDYVIGFVQGLVFVVIVDLLIRLALTHRSLRELIVQGRDLDRKYGEIKARGESLGIFPIEPKEPPKPKG